jgi:hypothetical protein
LIVPLRKSHLTVLFFAHRRAWNTPGMWEANLHKVPGHTPQSIGSPKTEYRRSEDNGGEFTKAIGSEKGRRVTAKAVYPGTSREPSCYAHGLRKSGVDLSSEQRDGPNSRRQNSTPCLAYEV